MHNFELLPRIYREQITRKERKKKKDSDGKRVNRKKKKGTRKQE